MSELQGDCDKDFIINGITNKIIILLQIHCQPYNQCTGAVPKSDGGIRPIHDCSLPPESDLNSYAPDFEHYSFQSVDDAVSLLKYNHYAAKIDLRHAYRSVPISAHSQNVTGLHWTFSDGQHVMMFDTKPPYGSKASPTVFHRLSQSVKRMMERRGYFNVVAYQDDFLVTGSDYNSCFEAWQVLMSLLRNLGFGINYNKVVPPSQCLVFLGIQIDTISCELSLPADKLDSLQMCIADFMVKKRATKQQLQSLVGRLNFAAKVVRGARLFLCRLFDAISTLKKRHNKILLQGDSRAKLEWCHRFLATFNGIAAFMEDTPITPVMTDACLLAGGAFCNGDILYTVWEADYPEIADSCINYKETMIATLAMLRWGHMFKNRKIILYTDNQCAANIINKCSCKNNVLMKYMQDMFWTATKYNFAVKAIYMPGQFQIMADAISRLHEHVGLLHVQTLVNNWYLCHSNFVNVFSMYSMLNHMSMMSLLFVFEQVVAWRKVRLS
jgi:hypothetical protein